MTPKLLPSNIKVAHKIGSMDLFCHDVGIVYTQKPYIICVLSTDGSNNDEKASVIANISKKVYDFHTEWFKEGSYLDSFLGDVSKKLILFLQSFMYAGCRL